MARPATGNRKYNIVAIQAIHREIIRRHFVGQKASEIANALNISKQTISNVVNSPLAKELIEALHNGADRSAEDISGRIKSLAPEALDVVEDTIRDDAEPTKLRTNLAMKVLGLAGYVEPQKKQVAIGVGLINQEDISNIRNAVRGQQVEEVEAEVVG